VATTKPAETTKAQVAAWMVGAPVEAARPEHAVRSQRGAPLLSASGLVARDRRGLIRLGPVDLDLYSGEIVGIAGVAGNGQDELATCAAGLGNVAAGKIVFAGAELTAASTREFRSAGVGYLSADRAEEGLCLEASIRDNFVAGREQDRPFSRGGLMRLAAIGASAEAALARLSLRYRRLSDPARSLSGGNQQRLAIAREFERRPKLLVAMQPTRGVDIAGIAFIHGQIAAFRDGGGAVLLISEELDEILELCDRVIGLYGGRITGELSRAEADVEKVGRLMLGQKAA
jgi:simple sugar transport system ATP-binding protein